MRKFSRFSKIVFCISYEWRGRVQHGTPMFWASAIWLNQVQGNRRREIRSGGEDEDFGRRGCREGGEGEWGREGIATRTWMADLLAGSIDLQRGEDLSITSGNRSVEAGVRGTLHVSTYHQIYRHSNLTAKIEKNADLIPNTLFSFSFTNFNFVRIVNASKWYHIRINVVLWNYWKYGFCFEIEKLKNWWE